ncbi:MAG: hypothetical protein JWO12_96 [Frankiales bacterium]|nr:hypothetical protein [Frankiales bacterium]
MTRATEVQLDEALRGVPVDDTWGYDCLWVDGLASGVGLGSLAQHLARTGVVAVGRAYAEPGREGWGSDPLVSSVLTTVLAEGRPGPCWLSRPAGLRVGGDGRGYEAAELFPGDPVPTPPLAPEQVAPAALVLHAELLTMLDAVRGTSAAHRVREALGELRSATGPNGVLSCVSVLRYVLFAGQVGPADLRERLRVAAAAAYAVCAPLVAVPGTDVPGWTWPELPVEPPLPQVVSPLQDPELGEVASALDRALEGVAREGDRLDELVEQARGMLRGAAATWWDIASATEPEGGSTATRLHCALQLLVDAAVGSGRAGPWPRTGPALLPEQVWRRAAGVLALQEAVERVTRPMTYREKLGPPAPRRRWRRG